MIHLKSKKAAHTAKQNSRGTVPQELSLQKVRLQLRTAGLFAVRAATRFAS